MKIRGSSDKRGKDRLGEHKNRANRVKEPLERAPEVRKGRKGRPRRLRNHRRECGGSNFLGPGPPQSILDTKIPYLRY